MTTPKVAPPASAFSNGMLMAAGEVGARAIAFGATAFLSRRLGPVGFGLVGFATAFTTYFGLLVSGGMASIGARAIARDPSQASDLATGVAMLRATIAALLFGALWLTVGFVTLTPDERLLLRLSGLMLFTMSLDVTWAYKGLERGAWVAFALVIGQIGFLCAVFALVRSPADTRWVPVSQFVGEGIAALVLFVPLALRARHVAIRAALQLMRSATSTGLTRLLRALIFTFDVLLLGLIGQREELGLYTAAYRVCLLVIAIQAALHSSFWAPAARADTPARLGAVVSRMIGLCAAVGIPLVAGGILLAEPLMALLFGSAYRGGAPMLAWLLVSSGCMLGHGAYIVGFIAAGNPRRGLVIMAWAAFVNVAANLIVIPRFGATGAAIVTAVSEGVALAQCIIAGRMAGWHVRASVLGPSALAGAAMVVVLLLVRDRIDVILAVMAGGAVYTSALLFFGVPEDARPIVAAARRRGLMLKRETP